jgi:hypothetical protein
MDWIETRRGRARFEVEGSAPGGNDEGEEEEEEEKMG